MQHRGPLAPPPPPQGRGGLPPPPPPGPSAPSSSSSSHGGKSEQSDNPVVEENRRLKEENLRLRRELQRLKGGVSPEVEAGLRNKLRIVETIRAPHKKSKYLCVDSDGMLLVSGADEECFSIKAYGPDLQQQTKPMIRVGNSPRRVAETSRFILLGVFHPGSGFMVINKANWETLAFFELGGFELYAIDTTERYCAVAVNLDVHIFDLARVQTFDTFSSPQAVCGVRIYQDKFLIYDEAYDIVIRDIAAKKEVKRFRAIHAMRLLIWGDRLIIGGFHGAIGIYDLQTYQEVAKMEGHQNRMNDMAIVGDTLVSISKESMNVWDLKSFRLINSYPRQTDKGNFSKMVVWNGKVATTTKKKPDVLLWG